MTKINTRLTLYIISGLVLVLIIGAVVLMNPGAQVESVAELLSLGQRFLSELEYEQALVAFMRVIEIEPRNAQGYYGAARAHIGLGQTQEAVELLRLGVEMTGDAGLQALLEELLGVGQEDEVEVEQLDVLDGGFAGRANNTIAAYHNRRFAIQADGSLWGWGGSPIGNGTMDEPDSPVRIMDGVISISAGRDHTMALRADNSLLGWGSFRGMLLGLGYDHSNPAIDYPTPVLVMEDVIAVSAGSSHTMAIRTDGSLWGWGNNSYGKIGDGTTEFRSTPARIMDDVIFVVASTSIGGEYTMAITSDGSLWGWGRNHHGQLGDGTTTDRHSPVRILDNVVDVAVSESITMAIRADGSLWGWGAGNWQGLFDDNFGEMNPTPAALTPMRIMDDVVAVSLTSFQPGTLVVRADGNLWTWGYSGLDYHYTVGEISPTVWVPRSSPTIIMNDVAAVIADRMWLRGDIMMLRSDGSLWTLNVQSSGGRGEVAWPVDTTHIMDNIMLPN